MTDLKIMVLVLTSLMICTSSFAQQNTENREGQTQEVSPQNLAALLDEISRSEQEPLRKRDEMMKEFGVESKEAEKYQAIYKKNHAINEVKVFTILENGWPDAELIGPDGNRTICNVLQHCSPEIRVKYLPLMRQAVSSQQLSPQLLVRAEDRIATDQGELQLYGGQMKYYPESKSFNVWPIYDPIHIDKRRAQLGLIPIAEHLKNRFDFEWNLEEQVKRTKEFESKQSQKKR